MGVEGGAHLCGEVVCLWGGVYGDVCVGGVVSIYRGCKVRWVCGEVCVGMYVLGVCTWGRRELCIRMYS